MSAVEDSSFGDELLRIIRAEIAAYDARKDEASRLRRAADEAAAKADQAAKGARVKNATGADAFGDHLRAESLNRLISRQLQRAREGETTIVVNNSGGTASEDVRIRERGRRRLVEWLRGRRATPGGAR